MKAPKHPFFAVLAAGLVLGGTSDANAGRRPGAGAPRRIARPDLRCSIHAYRDAEGLQPIAPGADVVFGGGAPLVYVRVVAQNAGATAASGFRVSTKVQRNGSNVSVVDETLTLPGGLAKIYPLVTVPVASSSKIRAWVSIDTTDAVIETSEHNNVCTASFTASVAG